MQQIFGNSKKFRRILEKPKTSCQPPGVFPNSWHFRTVEPMSLSRITVTPFLAGRTRQRALPTVPSQEVQSILLRRAPKRFFQSGYNRSSTAHHNEMRRRLYDRTAIVCLRECVRHYRVVNSMCSVRTTEIPRNPAHLFANCSGNSYSPDAR